LFAHSIGLATLTEKLKTNWEQGLTPVDLDKRIAHFGTNRKEPPERTPYWEFFKKALDDFMLKLLLVCACINIGFEVGFAHDASERSKGKLRKLRTFSIFKKNRL
jgi:magnesium-transporting ATPase (P-type)